MTGDGFNLSKANSLLYWVNSKKNRHLLHRLIGLVQEVKLDVYRTLKTDNIISLWESLSQELQSVLFFCKHCA